VLFITELAPGGFAVEFPVDLGAVAIHPTIPGAAFSTQSLQVGDSSGTEVLPREDSDFDFCLIEPTSMGGCVVHRDRSQISPPTSAPYRSVRDLRRWIFKLSITRWMVLASGY